MVSRVSEQPTRNNLFLLFGLLLAILAGASLPWVLEIISAGLPGLPHLWVLAGLVSLGVLALVITHPMLGVYLLCFSIPLEHLQPIGPINFVKVIGWVVGIAWLLYKMRTELRFPISDGFRWLAAFSCVAVISLLWSGDKIATFLRLTTLLQLVAFYLVIVDLVNSKERIWRVMTMTSLGVVVASIGGAWLTLSTRSTRLVFVADVSPNAFTGLSAFALGVALSFLLSGVSFVGRVGAIGLILISIIPVALAGTTLGSLAIVMAILVVALLGPIITGKRRRSLRFLVALIIILGIAIYTLHESPWWDRLVFAYLGPPFMEGRGVLWPAMFYRWMERPLQGWGFGASFDVGGLAHAIRSLGLADPRGLGLMESTAPHNALLWAALELGAVGVAIWAGVYWVHVRHLIRVIRRSTNRDVLSVRIALVLVVTTVVILSLSMGEDITLRRFFWLNLALIDAAWVNTNDTHQVPYRYLRW